MPRYDALIDNRDILGGHFVRSLNDTSKPLFRDGKRPVTKHQFVLEYGCGNFAAARGLQDAAKALGFTSVKELFTISPRLLGDMHGFGVTRLYALICYGMRQGIDIHKWFTEGVTFGSLKARALKEAAKDREVSKKATERRKQTGRKTLKGRADTMLATAADKG